MSELSRVVATGASVLINLIHAGYLEILGCLTGYTFIGAPVPGGCGC
ncbi:MAG: hypothetical protein AB1486_27580 [Planctomycetota bacterium]